MGTIDDIKKLKDEGKSESEIKSSLKDSGIDENKINSLLEQLKIKEAVADQQTEGIKKEQNTNSMEEGEKEGKVMGNTTGSDENQYSGMQPSMLNTTVEEVPDQQTDQQYYPQAGEQYTAPQPGEAQYSEYDQYQAYQPQGLSSDTITQISEQIVDEKILSMKSQMEKVIDFKNIIESKVDSVDERLKKIEKIIDRLQLSILQKVGDYMTNVDDIKKELIETQKSFKSLLPPSKQDHQERPSSHKRE